MGVRSGGPGGGAADQEEGRRIYQCEVRITWQAAGERSGSLGALCLLTSPPRAIYIGRRTEWGVGDWCQRPGITGAVGGRPGLGEAGVGLYRFHFLITLSPRHYRIENRDCNWSDGVIVSAYL